MGGIKRRRVVKCIQMDELKKGTDSQLKMKEIKKVYLKDTST